MGCQDPNVPNLSGNPGNPIHDVEPVSVDVRPDFGVAGVTLEVVDSGGAGFRTIFDQHAAVELVLRITGAIARLRGWSTP